MKKEKKKETKEIQNPFKNKKRQVLIYVILVLIDITLIIYSAKRNYINYVTLKGLGNISFGTTKDLLFGKNYITLIITFFFFTYILLCNKLLFDKKNTKIRTILTLIGLLILNIILFYIFTKRIY